MNGFFLGMLSFQSSLFGCSFLNVREEKQYEVCHGFVVSLRKLIFQISWVFTLVPSEFMQMSLPKFGRLRCIKWREVFKAKVCGVK